MKKILVPVDGSLPSCMAAKWAAQLVQHSKGKITLLHVYDLSANDAMGLASLSKQEVTAIKERIASASFDSAKAQMGNCEPATISDTGDPADEIISLAKREDFDLIVMGSRGMSPVRELLLGSVSNETLRRTHCPVTIIR